MIGCALVMVAELAGLLSRFLRSLAPGMTRVGLRSCALICQLIRAAIGPEGRRGHHTPALPFLLLALPLLLLALCMFLAALALRICAGLIALGDRSRIRIGLAERGAW